MNTVAHKVEKPIEAEAKRLLRSLMHVECSTGRKWNIENCREIAPLTLEINRLKQEKNAVILTHSYVEPEIIYGVGDFAGDSYYLSDKAREARADVIVFAGVVFMAETAKILCPGAQVVVPDRASGCSLADSITGEDVRSLKALHPDAAVVCYINSTAEVKAESDVCVTSSNVFDIVAALPQQRILFVPDRLMADNLRNELELRGVDKEIVSSDGTCMVHEEFTPEQIAEAREVFPGLKVVAHPECTPEVADIADFVGSTSAMMQYVRSSQAPYYLMLTECGLVGRLAVEDPEKNFIGGCRLCPYMKMNSLEKVRDALAHPRPDQIINLDEDLRLRAARCIDRMFELAPGIDALIDLALEEDAAFGDVTSEAIFTPDHTSSATISAREDLTLCGIDVARRVFARVDPSVKVRLQCRDGEQLAKGKQVLNASGPTISLLIAERTALNFLQHLSGIATLARRFAEAATRAGTGVRIVDTRKTTPGWRALEKYAVRCGGCFNHRSSLSEHVLIKDNHIAAAGSIKKAVTRARAAAPHCAKIEVEADSLSGVKAALKAGADIIMLDNMKPQEIKAAVSLIDGAALVEVSGNVSLETVFDFALPGVDVISAGALTHSATAVDLSMTLTSSPKR